MEEENEHHDECKNIMDDQNHQPRKILNFNAPLLSMRRPANLAAIDLSSCPSIRRRTSISSEDRNRIPFSWEKTPGKPKETSNDKFNDDNDNNTPRPKLPPCLWPYRHMISTLSTTKNDNNFKCDTSIKNNDDDRDDNSDDINNENDDVFSLSEAIDIVEKSQKNNPHENDRLRLKIVEDRLRNDNYYPDFMIQRFLPDATACSLSAMSLKRSSNSSDSLYRDHELQICSANRTISTSFSPPKGCGFEMLFPWRVKHRLSGVKSLIRRERSGAFGCISSEQVLHRRHKEKRRW